MIYLFNMLIKVKELQEGDEFITCSGSQFRYFKLLKFGNTKSKWGIRLKCSTLTEDKEFALWNGRKRKVKIFKFCPDITQHNCKMSIGLHRERNVILTKRNEQFVPL